MARRRIYQGDGERVIITHYVCPPGEDHDRQWFSTSLHTNPCPIHGFERFEPVWQYVVPG